MAKKKTTLNDIAESFGITWDKLTDDLIEWGYMKKNKDFKKAYADMFEWSDKDEDFIVSKEALEMIETDDWKSAYVEESKEKEVEETKSEDIEPNTDGVETSEESESEGEEETPDEEESEDDKSDEDVDTEDESEEDESGEIDIGDNPFDESLDDDSNK